MLETFTLRRTVEREDVLYRELLARAPRGYRIHRGILRSFGAAAVCAYMAARYRIVDLFLLRRLDAGWRPWHLVRLRLAVLRIVNAVTRQGTPTASAPQPVANEQFARTLPQRPPPVLTGLRTAATMLLYRFYAFVGRSGPYRTMLPRLWAWAKRRLGRGA